MLVERLFLRQVVLSLSILMKMDRLNWSTRFLLLCFGVSLVSAQQHASIPKLELQPSQTQRVEEQGRGFVVTCRIPESLKGTNLRWTQGSNRKPINEANGRIQVMKKPSADQPTSIVLIFNNVTKQDEGLYTCLANINDYPTEAQKEFQLSIYMGINFDSVQFVQTADIGKDYTVKCNVQGSPAPSISWRRNSVAIDSTTGPNGKYRVIPEGLTIYNVSRADGGHYECEASQMVEDITSKFLRRPIQLVVNYPPEFSNKTPAVSYSFLGGEVNLTCQADGEPAPQYDWGYYEDDRFVEMSLSDVKIREDFAMPSSSYIQKNMTDKSHFRDIVCRARNPLGSAERKFKVIEVDKPTSPRTLIHRVHGNKIEFELHPPPDNSPLKIVGYRALIKPKGGDNWENATIFDFKMGKFHIVDSLYHGTDYEVRFAAKNEVGYGEFSNVLLVKTSDVSAGYLLTFSKCTLLFFATFVWLLVAV